MPPGQEYEARLSKALLPLITGGEVEAWAHRYRPQVGGIGPGGGAVGGQGVGQLSYGVHGAGGWVGGVRVMGARC